MMEKKRLQTADEVLAESEAKKEKEQEPVKADEKERTYLEILRDKIKVYTIEVDPDFAGPKNLYLKRWSYGTSVELAPIALGIIGTVFSSVAPMLGGTSGVENIIVSVLGDSRLISSVSAHMKDISKIIARTMLTHSENKITDYNEAVKFVNGLDPSDIIKICKIMFLQNFGHLGKNELGLTLERTTGVSEK